MHLISLFFSIIMSVFHVFIVHLMSYVDDHLFLCVSIFHQLNVYSSSSRSSVILAYSYGRLHFILHLIFFLSVPPFLIFSITAFLYTYILTQTLFRHASYLFFLISFFEIIPLTKYFISHTPSLPSVSKTSPCFIFLG
jgi:hypothetical protein